MVTSNYIRYWRTLLIRRSTSDMCHGCQYVHTSTGKPELLFVQLIERMCGQVPGKWRWMEVRREGGREGGRDENTF